MRLIDADALKQTFQRWANVPEYNEAERHIIRAAMIAVDDCPTIDDAIKEFNAKWTISGAKMDGGKDDE